MRLVIVISGLAIATALAVLQLVVLNNAPPPDPAAIFNSPQDLARQRAYDEAIRASDRFLSGVPPTPAEDAAENAARECEARARMAAAVHRADPVQVREACLFTWRTTGRLPRP
jgi:hypothetical protein